MNIVLNQKIDNKLYWLLSIWIFLLFLSGKGNQFVVWDDPKYVYENALITNPKFVNLIKLFKSVVVWNYHPVTMFSFWLNSFLFGTKPISFIIINAAIHTINVLLILKLTIKLTQNRWIGFFVALFWGIHPMHVESVTWVSQRKDVLYVLFFLLACLEYIKYLDTHKRQSIVYCFAFFLFACLSKGVAVILPIILVLISHWFDKFSKIELRTLIPFLVVSIVIGIINIKIFEDGEFLFLTNYNSLKSGAFNIEASLWQRLIFAGYGLGLYLIKFFIPINLHHWYVFPESFDKIIFLASPLAILITLGFGIYNLRRSKVIFFGVFFYFFNLALVLQFFPQGRHLVAERYTYLPYFGLLFIIFGFLSQYKSKVLTAGLLGIALLFTFLSFIQIKVWRNTLTLWEQTFKSHPENRDVAISLISQYRQRDNQEKVIETAQKAIDAGLKSGAVYQILANAQLVSGDFKNAIINTNLAEQFATPQDSISTQVIYLQKVTAFDGLGRKDSALFYMNKAQQLLMKK